MNQPDWLARQATARPQHPAIVHAGGALTFATLARRVARLAAALEVSAPGPRIGCVFGNGPALAECVLACLHLGRTAILFDPRLGEAEAAPLAEATAPGAILGDRAGADVARSLAARTGARFHLHDALVDAAGPGIGPVGIDLDRAAVVVFSSGTSGRPKPIELTAGNLLWSALAGAARLGSHPDDRWLACLPLSHVGGLSILFRSVLLGTTMIVQPGFESGAVRRALAEEGVSLVSLVPTTLARLLDEVGDASIAAPHLRCALIGGASAPLDLLVEARARGIPAAPTYGATEAASQIATLPPEAPLVETGGVGAPLLPTRVRIVTPQGGDAAPGVAGTIEVHGPTLAPGAVDAAGWLRTGDLGRLDDNGALTVLGRRDDVIVTGGENVSPGEVEGVLARLDGVAEVAVAAVEDRRWGHVVGAWVVPSPGHVPTLETVRRACSGKLAPHKRPRRLYLVDSLPRTALGKIRRGALSPASGPEAPSGGMSVESPT